MERIKRFWQAEKPMLLLCLAATFLLGFAAHGYGFFRNSLSHDVLNAFAAGEAEELWKIELGRFAVPAYRFLFRGSLSLPWLIGLLGLIWCTAAGYVTVKLFDIKSKGLAALLCGILVTNITWISQIAAYLYEFDINAFALLLSLCAVWIWKSERLPMQMLGALVLAVCIGLYQAYAAVTVSMMILISILDTLREKPLKVILVRGLWGIGMLLLGGIVYLLGSKAVCLATGVTPQSRVDIFAQMGDRNPILFYLELIPTAIRDLGNRIIHPAYPRALVGIAIAVTVAVLGVPGMIALIRKKFTPGRWILLLALTAALPFGMQMTYFLSGGQGVHDLMSFAPWLFYCIPLLFYQWLRDNEKALPLCQIAAWGLIVLLIFQNVRLANTAYVKKELEANASLSTMTRVVAMLEQQEGYEAGKTPVAIIGNGKTYRPPAAFDKVSAITGLSDPRAIPTDMDSHYYNAYRAYFDYVLQYPIVLCGEDIRGSLRIDPRVEAMPAFPAAGCMAFIDNILVVNMG